jgi:hypothetical protein
MGWRVFQFSIFAAFLFANIYFEWGIEGIAAPVMGGMLAWYLSYAAARILWRMGYIEKPLPINLLYRP